MSLKMSEVGSRLRSAGKWVLVAQFLLFLFYIFLRTPDPPPTPYPALQRLVAGVDRFLWSRFDLHSFTIDPECCNASYPAQPTSHVATGDEQVMEFCSRDSSILIGRLEVGIPPKTMPEVARLNPDVEKGGKFKPKDCAASSKVAIIIPFRGREDQLRHFLFHMHPVLQRQKIEYAVYVINQQNGALFNRAKLMNVGFSEAWKDNNYDCYVFHDVDLLLSDDRCGYYCPDVGAGGRSNPVHISAKVDEKDYSQLSYDLELCSPVPYQATRLQVFGGVSMFTHAQFVQVNGFSNMYWGWGAEDDDLYLRTWKKGYRVEQKKGCRHHMLSHTHETNNPMTPMRYLLLKQSLKRQDSDGLNSLKYKVLSKHRDALYTNVTVDVGTPAPKLHRLSALMRKDFGPESDFSCFQALLWMYNKLPQMQ